jgi:hypothetical protein
MNNFKASYEKILEVMQSKTVKHNFIAQKRKPKLSDIELISLELAAQYMGIDSECQLFRVMSGLEIADKIERTVYNRRKRKLAFHINDLRLKLAQDFNEFEDTFIIDSMPLEVCKMSRSSRAKICREAFHSAPDKGFCASQQTHFYGYKLHAVCSLGGVFQSIDMSKASVHDIHFLKDVKYQFTDCVLLGDKGYLSSTHQSDLFESANITLETPLRRNQKDYKLQPFIFRKSRKRIETLFSQLCDQFKIRNNYAKSFQGFKTRILAKITALTVIQYINKFVFNRPINNIKVLINY